MPTFNEINEQHGYPIAFRHPKWERVYFVSRSLTSIEFWENDEQIKDKPGELGREFYAISALFFHWYEDNRFEPMFGFY